MMKTTRIVTAMFCALAMVALYGCGGSSQLAETPTELEAFIEAANVHIDASGLDQVVSSSQDQAKAFFDSDPFSGTGSFDGEGSADTIAMECEFMVPTIVDLGLPAASGTIDGLVLTGDVANCNVGGVRNCCVYTLSARQQNCTIDIDCLIDPENNVTAVGPVPENIANTGLQSEIRVYQTMTTNMNDNSGVIMLAIEKTAASLNVFSDLSGIALDLNDAYGEVCYTDGDPAHDDQFTVLDDSSLRWDGEDATANDNDVAAADYVWEVSDIGTVQLSALDSIASCEISYDNMIVTATMAEVANSGTAVESLTLSGKGRICNSLSYTDCEGDAMWEFAAEPF